MITMGSCMITVFPKSCRMPPPRLAMEAAHGLSSYGLPLLALQALHIALAITPEAPSDAVQSARRAALCRVALRAVLSACPGAVAGTSPRDALVRTVAKQLSAVQAAGVELDVETVAAFAQQLQVCADAPVRIQLTA